LEGSKFILKYKDLEGYDKIKLNEVGEWVESWWLV
jgi:hypothetical protein